jgi:hypothetical protein
MTDQSHTPPLKNATPLDRSKLSTGNTKKLVFSEKAFEGLIDQISKRTLEIIKQKNGR